MAVTRRLYSAHSGAGRRPQTKSVLEAPGTEPGRGLRCAQRRRLGRGFQPCPRGWDRRGGRKGGVGSAGSQLATAPASECIYFFYSARETGRPVTQSHGCEDPPGGRGFPGTDSLWTWPQVTDARGSCELIRAWGRALCCCLNPAWVLEGLGHPPMWEAEEGEPGVWPPSPPSWQRQWHRPAGRDSSLPVPASWARASLTGTKPPPQHRRSTESATFALRAKARVLTEAPRRAQALPAPVSLPLPPSPSLKPQLPAAPPRRHAPTPGPLHGPCPQMADSLSC